MFRYRELVCFLILLSSIISTEILKDGTGLDENEVIIYEGLLDRIVDDTYYVFLLESERKELILEASSFANVKVGEKYQIKLFNHDRNSFHISPIREYSKYVN